MKLRMLNSLILIALCFPVWAYQFENSEDGISIIFGKTEAEILRGALPRVPYPAQSLSIFIPKDNLFCNERGWCEGLPEVPIILQTITSIQRVFQAPVRFLIRDGMIDFEIIGKTKSERVHTSIYNTN